MQFIFFIEYWKTNEKISNFKESKHVVKEKDSEMEGAVVLYLLR